MKLLASRIHNKIRQKVISSARYFPRADEKHFLYGSYENGKILGILAAVDHRPFEVYESYSSKFRRWDSLKLPYAIHLTTSV
jgi:hypothetical protein